MVTMTQTSKLPTIPAPMRRTAPVNVQYPEPHLSFSQLRLFSQCSLAWQLSRQFQPAFVPVALLFGGAFHAAVERYYQARLEGRAADVADLLSAFDAHWQQETEPRKPPVKFNAKAEDATAMRDLAERMLTVFLASMGRISNLSGL